MRSKFKNSRKPASTLNSALKQQSIEFQKALSFHKQGQLVDAQATYLAILKTQPSQADALHLLGVIEIQIGNYQEAVELTNKAIDIDSNQPFFYSSRGIALRKLNQFGAAIASYDKAICLKPDYAEAHYNRSIALGEIKQYDAAIRGYNAAIWINPDYADAYNNLGNALKELNQYGAAIESYDVAIRLEPDYEYIYGIRLHCKMFVHDWRDFDHELDELVRKIQAGARASAPFPLLALTNSLSLQQQAARITTQDKHPINWTLGDIVKQSRKKRIRIGYYSADFHDHATAYLMAELFEKHDRKRFELFAFSFGPDKTDGMRQRVSSSFDQFLDVKLQSDQAVGQLSRDLGIDLAIDLKGYTQHARAGIFSFRAAPIQISYLGYPGTMAARYMDYLIADRILIPIKNKKYYTEKIAYLPHSYQVNDTKRQIADRQFSREELGLPRDGFVFCCFNNTFKITPAIFDCWMRVLKKADGSVLWLLECNSTAVLNLGDEAERRGIDRARLIFAKRLPLAEHLARHRVADLFLDTLPYNAHTTASDALWAGLPVLTCMGESFASRVAASLLNAIELPELITANLEEYESLAIQMATHPEKLQVIRQKLKHNRLTTPLFDISLFTSHIEDAYLQMYERYHADLPPDHIYVDQKNPS